MKQRHRTRLGVAIACLALSTCVSAEEYRLGEIFAGYSLLHGDLQKRASGWELSAGKNLNQWLSLHADFDAHHQSSAGSQRHQHDFLFGPQFSHRTNHFTLFAHALAGGCRTPEAEELKQASLQRLAAESIWTTTEFSLFALPRWTTSTLAYLELLITTPDSPSELSSVLWNFAIALGQRHRTKKSPMSNTWYIGNAHLAYHLCNGLRAFSSTIFSASPSK